MPVTSVQYLINTWQLDYVEIPHHTHIVTQTWKLPSETMVSFTGHWAVPLESLEWKGTSVVVMREDNHCLKNKKKHLTNLCVKLVQRGARGKKKKKKRAVLHYICHSAARWVWIFHQGKQNTDGSCVNPIWQCYGLLYIEHRALIFKRRHLVFSDHLYSQKDLSLLLNTQQMSSTWWLSDGQIFEL